MKDESLIINHESSDVNIGPESGDSVDFNRIPGFVFADLFYTIILRDIYK